MPPVIEDSDTWIEYRRLVLGELERLNATTTLLDRKLDELRNEIRSENDRRDAATAAQISELKVSVAMLQVKSGLWGAGSGLLVALGEILLMKMH